MAGSAFHCEMDRGITLIVTPSLAGVPETSLVVPQWEGAVENHEAASVSLGTLDRTVRIRPLGRPACSGGVSAGLR